MSTKRRSPSKGLGGSQVSVDNGLELTGRISRPDSASKKVWLNENHDDGSRSRDVDFTPRHPDLDDMDEPTTCPSKFQKAMRSFWRTRLTEDTNNDQELYVKTTLRELIIYIGFIIILCILTFGMASSTMFYYTKVMKDLFVDVPNFNSYTSLKHFWDYSEEHLLNGLYWEQYYNNETVPKDKRGFIYFENKLLGRPRLRQIRVRNDSCVVHKDFKNDIIECYAPYSLEVEDRSAFREVQGLNDTAYGVFDFYNLKKNREKRSNIKITNDEYVRGDTTFGTDIRWVYQSSEELNGNSFNGRMATYGGGGYTKLLGESKEESRQIIADLKKNLWLDRGTRAVFIDFTVYNANINLFCIITLILEYPATGGCIPYSKFRTLKLLRYVTSMDYFVMACELIFVFYLIYYSVEEIIEIRIHKFTYFKEFWNVFDVIIIVMGIIVVVFNLYRVVEVQRLLTGLLSNSNQYANFESLGFWQELFNDFIAIAVFISWIKIFKYISFNKTMTQLQSTLARCAKDIAGFAVMFFIIFLAYAQWGYLIFGTQVEGFSTYMSSIFTLFRIILGDFNFGEIEQANRILGPIFFLTYVFFVFFVLINMFLAIINDTYAEVKSDLAKRDHEFLISDYLKKGYGKMMAKLSFKREKVVEIQKALQTADKNFDNKVDYDEWRTNLKGRGHTDAEIEAIFVKYDIDGDRVLNEVERRTMNKDLEDFKNELTGEIEEVERAKLESSRLQSKISVRDDDEEEDVDDDDNHSEGRRKGVQIEEFTILSKRVDRVQHSIGSIVLKIDAVLTKLEAMDKAKIKRRETMTRLLDSITEQGSQNSVGEDDSNRRNMLAIIQDEVDSDALGRPNSSQSRRSRPGQDNAGTSK